MAMPTLIAVIGPVEPPLLREFVLHYAGLGLERFMLGFHFPEDTAASTKHELLATCRELVGSPETVSAGPWHATINGDLRDQMRHRAGPGWHLLADIDEFQFYPMAVPELIETVQYAGGRIISGLMLDRVSADGRLCAWSPADGLDQTYRLGGFLTHSILKADPRKVVLAHSSVGISRGNHTSPGQSSLNDPLVVVHHFKWRSGVADYLRHRISMFSTGSWREKSPAVRTEAQRFLNHLDMNGGCINLETDSLLFRPVNLRELPSWWDVESRSLADQWTLTLPAREVPRKQDRTHDHSPPNEN